MSYYERAAEEKGYFHFHCGEIGQTNPHFHGAVEFLFVRQGNIEVTVGGEKKILGAFDACFSDSFCVHSYLRSGAEGIVLLGARSAFISAFSAHNGKVPPRFFRFGDFTLLDTLYSFCHKDFQDEKNRYSAFEGSVKILTSAIAENTPFLPLKSNKQNDLVCDLLKYAEENLASDLSLEALSQKFGYTREHLSRLLNKHLSENWTAYLNRARVRKAYDLLLSYPERSVMQIAWECGFESANTFYRAYKKEFGVPPRQ